MSALRARMGEHSRIRKQGECQRSVRAIKAITLACNKRARTLQITCKPSLRRHLANQDVRPAKILRSSLPLSPLHFSSRAFHSDTVTFRLAFQNGAGANQNPRIDTPIRRRNTQRMTRPEAVRRVKSYSAETGYVYQYYFYEVNKTRRGLTPGTEY